MTKRQHILKLGPNKCNLIHRLRIWVRFIHAALLLVSTSSLENFVATKAQKFKGSQRKNFNSPRRFEKWSRFCAVILFFLLQISLIVVIQAAPTTYAVIVGITQYKDEGIEPLKFANRDATAFADYLKSESGGNVPERNIKLLLDQNATYPAVYNELQWLTEVCKENDLVYFYFSGHGDVENTTIYKLGFLITYNTYRNNYMHNALSIEHLNYYANTLSLANKAKVVLITDACHSGKLAGDDFRGNLMVGKQLDTILNNEIRLSSCKPEQKSYENEYWGGGRSAFSFYLMQGLNGQVPRNKDTLITLAELSTHLTKSLSQDPYLKDKEVEQTPILKGNQTFTFKVPGKKVSDSSMQAVPIATTAAPLPKAAQWYFFDIIKQRLREDSSKLLEKQFNFNYLDSLPIDQLVPAIIEACREDKYPDLGKRLDTLKQTLESNDYLHGVFKKSLVTLLGNRGDEIINLYIAGDEAEIERRRYYNSVNNDYGVYAKMYSIAVKLSNKSAPLTEILLFKKYYFSALATQLAIPKAKDASDLINSALAQLNKAMEIKENAPYLHNDLGLLYSYKGDIQQAIKSFLRAKELAPKWILPFNNLAGIYTTRNELDKAMKEIDDAKNIQSNNYITILREALWYEKSGNLLLAKDFFYQAIRKNSRHFVPFEHLANIYLQTAQFALADSFYNEAASRKNGYNFKPYEPLGGVAAAFPTDDDRLIVCEKMREAGAKDITSQTVAGVIALQDQDYIKAESHLRKAVLLDKKNPIAYHYLGQALHKLERFAEAELIFKMAIQNYPSRLEFDKYASSLEPLISSGNQELDCVVNGYKKLYYPQIDDYFFLAYLYTDWNHFIEAENIYLELLKTPEGKANKATYYCLWKLYEQVERYSDAENIIKSFIEKDEVDALLFEFYRRVTIKQPNSGEWFYRAGNFAYQFVSRLERQDPCDRINHPFDEDINSNLKECSPEILKGVKSFKIPGNRYQFNGFTGVSEPRKKAIEFLAAADLLLTASNELADCNAKLGSLYNAMNRPDLALPHFKKASYLSPSNADHRISLIQTCDKGHYYDEANKNLDTLTESRTINYDMILLSTSYKILTKQFNLKDSLLAVAAKINLVNDDRIDELLALKFWFKQDYSSAIASYEKLSRNNPENINLLYHLARIYLLNGNERKALAYFEKALANGWQFKQVINNDKVLTAVRNKPKWRQAISKLH